MEKAVIPFFFYEKGEHTYKTPRVYQMFIVPVGVILALGVVVTLFLDLNDPSRPVEPWYHYLFWGAYGLVFIVAALRRRKNPRYTFVKLNAQEVAFKKEGEEPRQTPVKDIERISLDTAAAHLHLKNGETEEIPYNLMEYQALQEFKEVVKRSTDLRSEEKP